jgi:hypothetical protein
MKITAHHNFTTQTLNLLYDAEAQEALAQSAKTVRAFCQNRAVHDLAANRLSDLLPRFARAIDCLSQIIKSETRHIEITVDDMQDLNGAMLLATNYQAMVRGELATLPQSVLLLAKITPYALPPISLPPAVEVFDRSATSPAAWAGYEAVRLWTGSGLPYLPLFDLHELWIAFQVEPPTNNFLRIFSQWLSDNTWTYRDTLDLLAEAELAPINIKSARKPKKK